MFVLHNEYWEALTFSLSHTINSSATNSPGILWSQCCSITSITLYYFSPRWEYPWHLSSSNPSTKHSIIFPYSGHYFLRAHIRINQSLLGSPSKPLPISTISCRTFVILFHISSPLNCHLLGDIDHVIFLPYPAANWCLLKTNKKKEWKNSSHLY